MKYGSNQNVTPREISTGKGFVLFEILSQFSATEIQLLKGKKRYRYFADGQSKITYEKEFMDMDDAKEIWESHLNLGLEKDMKFSTVTFSMVIAHVLRYQQKKQIISFLDLCLRMSVEQEIQGDQEAQILTYCLAVKKLEAQLVTSQKQQLSLNEKLAFQANEIHEKDEKLKRYRRIGMKAVKEKEQLQKNVDSGTISKNLWRLINSGMRSNDKLGLGFEIQSNDEVLSYEEEINSSVFRCSKEDSIGKPSYSRFTKTNDFKGVPPPLSGDYTPQPPGGNDDALYILCKKDATINERKMAREAEEKRVVNTGNGVTKTCLSNANRINHSNNFVPRSVQLNTCRPKFNSVRPNINTGRTNISSGRPKVNSDRPKVNTVSPKVNSVGTTSNSMSPKRPQMDQINQRRDFSKSYSSVRRPFAKSTAQMAHANAVMGSWGSAVKSSASYNWRNPRPNFNYNSGPTFIRTVNANGPQGRNSMQRPGPKRIIYLFMGNKGIKQEYSTARTPQQNGVAERMNRTLIEAARTMLADSLLPTTFWAEAVFQRKLTVQVLQLLLRKKMKEVEILLLPSAVKIPEEKDASRTTSKNSKPEETLKEPQTEMKDSSTNPKIQAFRRDQFTDRLDNVDSVLPELEIFVTSLRQEFLMRHLRWKRNLNKIAKLYKMTVGFKVQQEELLQFQRYQQVWVLVDLPHGMRGGELKHQMKRFIVLAHNLPGFVDPMISNRFQMSSMGELTFFLGLQVKQNKGGIFISQDKYVAEILKKFDLVNVKAAIINPWRPNLPLTWD
ncbi:putative ribonuclease H-like domain-containing protein [Tanacetum coccineum]